MYSHDVSGCSEVGWSEYVFHAAGGALFEKTFFFWTISPKNVYRLTDTPVLPAFSNVCTVLSLLPLYCLPLYAGDQYECNNKLSFVKV